MTEEQVLDLTTLETVEAMEVYGENDLGYNRRARHTNLYLLDEPINGFNAIYRDETNADDWYHYYHFILVNYDENETTCDGVHRGIFYYSFDNVFHQIDAYPSYDEDIDRPVIQFDDDGNVIFQTLWS